MRGLAKRGSERRRKADTGSVIQPHASKRLENESRSRVEQVRKLLMVASRLGW